MTREVEGGVPGVSGVAIFLGEGEGDAGVGENEARLGHADTLDGLKASCGETQGAVSCEAYIFGGENHHAASDEFRVLTGFDHPSKVVKSGIDVGTAHRFDESGNGVVVMVAFFVVAGEFLAGGFDDNIFRDFLTQRCGEFQVAESRAGVATGELGEVIEGIQCYDGFIIDLRAAFGRPVDPSGRPRPKGRSATGGRRYVSRCRAPNSLRFNNEPNGNTGAFQNI